MAEETKERQAMILSLDDKVTLYVESNREAAFTSVKPNSLYQHLQSDCGYGNNISIFYKPASFLNYLQKEFGRNSPEYVSAQRKLKSYRKPKKTKK